MSTIATRGSRAALGLLLLATVATLCVARAEAQVNPLWDHYKAYFLSPPLPPPPTVSIVTLRDQFGESVHQVLVLEQFANPVEKIHDPAPPYPINDPILHYAWWQIDPQTSTSLQVAAVNQFGDHTLDVFNAHYLWNPAVKNQPGPPPLRNHYKCYDCQGPPVNATVGMVDQFGPWQAQVTVPRLFCNPVEKTLGPPGSGGQVYPILDPNQHYVCYEYLPEDPTPRTASMTDQFLTEATLVLQPSRLLCVPTYKSGVTSSTKDTWGRLKLLYR